VAVAVAAIVEAQHLEPQVQEERVVVVMVAAEQVPHQLRGRLIAVGVAVAGVITLAQTLLHAQEQQAAPVSSS
jgi:hypothetical protein